MKVKQFMELASAMDFEISKPLPNAFEYVATLPEGYNTDEIKTTWFGGTMIITHPEKPPIYLGKDNKFHELKVNRHA